METTTRRRLNAQQKKTGVMGNAAPFATSRKRRVLWGVNSGSTCYLLTSGEVFLLCGGSEGKRVSPSVGHESSGSSVGWILGERKQGTFLGESTVLWQLFLKCLLVIFRYIFSITQHIYNTCDVYCWILVHVSILIAQFHYIGIWVLSQGHPHLDLSFPFQGLERSRKTTTHGQALARWDVHWRKEGKGEGWVESLYMEIIV